MKKIIDIIKKKWLKDTFLTAVLIIIIFAVYFLINWGVEKLNISDIDLTADKIYSLSDSSKTKLKDMDKEVKIQLVNLSTYNYLVDFANKYNSINSKITVEKIDDLSARPDIMSNYGMESTDNAILFTSGDRETILTLSDLYTYDYTTYEEIDVTEEAFTNAIIQVTIENKPHVYFLEGHNAYSSEYFILLQQDIQAEANEVESLNILSAGSIPETCNCLVITTLKEDITELEKDKILEYINKGGKILLLSDADVAGIETPNFNQILDLYGFNISKGIIFEQDKNQMIYDSPEIIISKVNSESVIAKNIKMNMSVCLLDAGRIEFKDEDKLSELGVTYEQIATTSDSAFIRDDFTISSDKKTSKDQDAANSIVGALVTKKISDETKSELIVYSNGIFATNQQIKLNDNYTMYANKLCNNDDVVINSIAHLTQRTDTITIRKDHESVSYTVNESQHNVIMIVIFGTPVLIIIAGIVVWQIRRRKK